MKILMVSTTPIIPSESENEKEQQATESFPSDNEKTEKEEEEEQNKLQDACNQLYIHSINILKRFGMSENKKESLQKD